MLKSVLLSSLFLIAPITFADGIDDCNQSDAACVGKVLLKEIKGLRGNVITAETPVVTCRKLGDGATRMVKTEAAGTTQLGDKDFKAEECYELTRAARKGLICTSYNEVYYVTRVSSITWLTSGVSKERCLEMLLNAP